MCGLPVRPSCLPHRSGPPFPPAGLSSSSEDAEISVRPILDTVPAAPGGEGSAGRAPLASDDADMEGDAVMLEYDAADAMVSLSQLSLDDTAAAAQDRGPPPTVGEQQEQQAAAGDAPAGTPDEAQPAAAAAAGGKGEITDALQPGGSPPVAAVAANS